MNATESSGQLKRQSNSRPESRLSTQYILEHSWQTFARFPLVILAAVLTAVLAILNSELNYLDRDFHAIITAGFGIPLFLALALVSEKSGLYEIRKKFLEGIFGVVLLSCIYLLTERDFSKSYAVRALQLALIFHLCIAITPWICRKTSEQFWLFNRILFQRILLSVLYATVLWGGLSIALITIEKLFALKVREQLYTDIWILSAVVFQTWHFLAGVPVIASLESDSVYPRGLRIFIQYLLIPLTSLYMLILYAYMAKILLERSWPQGSVGWLVSVMSVLGVFNLLMIEPERKRADSRWIQIYSRSFYLLIVPLLCMLFTALFIRVGEYGLTEIRYCLGLLGVLLIACSAYFVMSKQKKIEVIPVSLLIVSAVMFAGPWSPYSIALKNQLARGEEILNRNHLLIDGKIPAKHPDMPQADEMQFSGVMDYLLEWHGKESIRRWLAPEQFDKLASDSDSHGSLSSTAVMEQIGLDYLGRNNFVSAHSFQYFAEAGTQLLDVAGYSQVIPFTFYSCPGNCRLQIDDAEKVELVLTPKPFTLELRKQGTVQASVSMEDSIQNVIKNRKTSVATRKEKQADVKPNRAVLAIEGQSAKVYVQEINGSEENGQRSLSSFVGFLILRSSH